MSEKPAAAGATATQLIRQAMLDQGEEWANCKARLAEALDALTEADRHQFDYPKLVSALRHLYTRGNYLGKRAEEDATAILAEINRLRSAGMTAPRPQDALAAAIVTAKWVGHPEAAPLAAEDILAALKAAGWRLVPADESGWTGIANGTHEPAVDDFGVQYLRRVDVSGVCHNCGQPMIEVAIGPPPPAPSGLRIGTPTQSPAMVRSAIEYAAEACHMRDWDADNQGGHKDRDWRKCIQWPCPDIRAALAAAPEQQPGGGGEL